MNTIKVKTTIKCNTCGCSMKRSKSIKVQSEDKSEAIKEANEKTSSWVESLSGQNCRICKSIIQGS